MNCAHCAAPIPPGSRRDRVYCDNKCSALASYYRRKNGAAPPSRWQHPALGSADPVLRAAADRAGQLGETHGWSPSTIRCALDGLTVLLDGRPAGGRVTLTEIRTRTPRHTSVPRVAEVLAGLDLLEDDSIPAVRCWVERCANELPQGFAGAVRAWLLVLLDGDARARPRSHASIYVYFTAVQPLIERWSADRGHLREITAADVKAALDPLRGHQLRTATVAVRSLFRFAKKRGLIFANPAMRLKAADPGGSLLPMTDAEIRAVEQAAASPAQRLIVALAAVHAARWAAIRDLTLDDLDLPNRRITIGGHRQRLGELTYRTLRAWLDHRRATWPHTPNPHLLISEKTALGSGPVTRSYLNWNLQRHGVSIERIRRDRVLHEALTARADPLHLALVFGLSHTTASKYTLIACDLLADQPPTLPGSRTALPAKSQGYQALKPSRKQSSPPGGATGPPMSFLLGSASGDGAGVLTDRIGYRRCSSRATAASSRSDRRPGAAACFREHTEDMNRERAETHLRQLAEAELRRAVKLPAGSIPGRWNSARLALVAQALSAVDAVVADTAAEIEANLDLAVAGRCPLYRRDAPWPPGKRAAPGLSTGRTQSASHRASRRIVPVGKVIQIRNEDLRRELLLVAFVQSAGGARFTMAGWPFRRFTAVDDQGASYQVGFAGGHAAGELLLRPDPPHPIRWLDLTTAPGEPATRIDLSPQVPAPDVIVTRKAHSPGELLLDVAAAWILTSAAAFPQDTPERLAAANPELLPHPAAGLGDIVAALQAAEALSPASPVPGQLAELCARLGISGHGILASVGGGLPERWQSMLSRYHRREPYPAPPTGRVAATVAELPDLDGAWVVILGLHRSEDRTILHVLASGVTTGDDWAYTRGVRPPPVVWIRDSSGRWHTTRTDGATPSGNTGDVMWWLEIVPPLDRGTAWIDVVTAGQSAEVRATLPLRWESAP